MGTEFHKNRWAIFFVDTARARAAAGHARSREIGPFRRTVV